MGHNVAIYEYDKDDLLSFYILYVRMIKHIYKLPLCELEIKLLASFYYSYNKYTSLGVSEEEKHILILSSKNLRDLSMQFSYTIGVIYNAISKIRKISIPTGTLIDNRTLNTDLIPLINTGIAQIVIKDGTN